MERYRRTVRTNTKKEDKADFKTKIIRQSIICGAIFTVVFVISLLKTETATKLNENISDTLSYTVNYRATIMEIANKITGLLK